MTKGTSRRKRHTGWRPREVQDIVSSADCGPAEHIIERCQWCGQERWNSDLSYSLERGELKQLSKLGRAKIERTPIRQVTKRRIGRRFTIVTCLHPMHNVKYPLEFGWNNARQNGKTFLHIGNADVLAHIKRQMQDKHRR